VAISVRWANCQSSVENAEATRCGNADLTIRLTAHAPSVMVLCMVELTPEIDCLRLARPRLGGERSAGR
jgi:hypothetical protein